MHQAHAVVPVARTRVLVKKKRNVLSDNALTLICLTAEIRDRLWSVLKAVFNPTDNSTYAKLLRSQQAHTVARKSLFILVVKRTFSKLHAMFGWVTL